MKFWHLWWGHVNFWQTCSFLRFFIDFFWKLCHCSRHSTAHFCSCSYDEICMWVWRIWCDESFEKLVGQSLRYSHVWLQCHFMINFCNCCMTLSRNAWMPVTNLICHCDLSRSPPLIRSDSSLVHWSSMFYWRVLSGTTDGKFATPLWDLCGLDVVPLVCRIMVHMVVKTVWSYFALLWWDGHFTVFDCGICSSPFHYSSSVSFFESGGTVMMVYIIVKLVLWLRSPANFGGRNSLVTIL